MIDPNFNPMSSAEFRANPYPILARVRDQHPVAHMSPGLVESWSILGYHDARKVLMDAETFSSNRSLGSEGGIG